MACCHALVFDARKDEDMLTPVLLPAPPQRLLQQSGCHTSTTFTALPVTM